MSAMDILCSSSRWGEGFPNVLGEAMAVGLPCVATDVGDSAHIIGECGAVVAPNNKVILAAAIESLLGIPDTERLAQGARGRSRVEAKFELHAIVEKYAQLYKTIISA